MKRHVEMPNKSGYILRGYVNVPSLDARYPTVIMLHGFTGHKTEGRFLFARTAAKLESQGFCVIRFDFAHSGDSDGFFEFMTPSGEVEDTLEILGFAQRLPYVDPHRVALLGYSLGGWVASLVAARAPEWVKALVLWSPGGNIAEVLGEFFEGTDKKIHDFEGLPIPRQAYEDVLSVDVYALAPGFKGKVLIVHETGDELVPFVYAERFKDVYGQQAELVAVAFKGHAFENIEIEKDVLQRTGEFLTKTL